MLEHKALEIYVPRQVNTVDETFWFVFAACKTG